MAATRMEYARARAAATSPQTSCAEEAVALGVPVIP
jgi:D-aminopeptidase